MSARYSSDAVDLSRYESLATGAIPARTAQELRTALALGRGVWQNELATQVNQRKLQTQDDLEKRKRALKERVRSKAMPTDKQLNAAAKLQSELANVGAHAAAAYNIQSLNKELSFSQRVDLASAADAPLGETVYFEGDNGGVGATAAATDTTQGSVSMTGSPTSTTTLESVSGLVSFGETAQAQIVSAGRAATDQLRAAADQSTNELAFVVASSAELLDTKMTQSSDKALAAMDERITAFEQRIHAATTGAISVIETKINEAFASADAAACSAGQAAATAHSAAATATEAAVAATKAEAVATAMVAGSTACHVVESVEPIQTVEPQAKDSDTKGDGAKNEKEVPKQGAEGTKNTEGVYSAMPVVPEVEEEVAEAESVAEPEVEEVAETVAETVAVSEAEEAEPEPQVEAVEAETGTEMAAEVVGSKKAQTQFERLGKSLFG